MLNLRAVAAVVCAGALAACTTGESTEQNAPQPDIAAVSAVKSNFGPEFKVSEVGPTGVDPRLLDSQQTPEGMSFEPADCADLATNEAMPADLKGNMAATTAEGQGNRFITIAVETSQPVPVPEPGENCQKVGFTGGQTRGLVEVVESPEISDVRTLGTHRVVQTMVEGKPRTGELYNYIAGFGNFRVIVTANPLVVPDQPVKPVDTKRAQDLLTAAVAAVKG